MATSDLQMNKFKEMVRQEWTDESTVAAWTKWFPKHTIQCQAGTAALLEAAKPAPGEQILDIAGGPGEPAISIARLIGPTGHITVTDLSAGMLATNERNMRAAGLTNASFQQADAHALKFPDQRFDLVTSRWGVMYFADPLTALQEIRRVLKPGGRAAFLAWGNMENNHFFGTALGPFFKRVDVPPPPPGMPTPARYAQAGSLSGDLRQAGFREVHEETRTINLGWPGTPEELWQHFYEVAVPFRPVIDGLPGTEREQAIHEAIEGFRRYYDGKSVNTPADIIVATGIR
jgi:SAM-dependent methyltransferase